MQRKISSIKNSSLALSHLILVVVFTVLAGASILFTILTRNASYRVETVTQNRNDILLAAARFHTHTTDLTRFARMFAVVGSSHNYGLWYQALTDNTLEDVLLIFSRLAALEEQQLFDRALVYYSQNRDLEARAFELLAQGYQSEAIALLYGEEYADAGRAMAATALGFIRLVDARTRAEVDIAKWQARLFEFFSITATILLALAAVFGIGFMVYDFNRLLGNHRESTHRTQFILDSLPMIITLWDKNFKIVDCNAEVLRRSGIKDKNEYLNNFASFMPQFQPDGVSSPEKAKQLLPKMFEKGGTLEWVYQDPQGNDVPLEVNTFPMEYRGNPMLLVLARDISDIRHREKLLNVVNEAAAVLLAVEDKEGLGSALQECLELIGRCLGADRAQLWQCTKVQEGLKSALIDEWQTEIGSKNPQIQFVQTLPFGLIPEFDELVLNFKPFCGPVSNLSEQAQRFLRADKSLKSVFFVPVIFRGELLGIFNLDDCEYERTVSQEEMDILRSASLLFATALHRVEQAADRWKLIHSATPIGVNYLTADFELIDSNEVAYKKIFGFKSLEEYKANVHLTMPEYQPDSSHTMTKIASDLKIVLEEGYYRSEWIVQNAAGEFIPLDVAAVRLMDNRDNIMIATYLQDLRPMQDAVARLQEAEEHWRYITDANPIGITFWNEESVLVDCNEAAYKMFGAKSKDEFIRNIASFWPEYQPDGQKSVEKVITINPDIRKKGYLRFDWIFQTLDGETVPIDVIAVSLQYKGATMIACFLQDLRPVRAALELEHTKEAHETISRLIDASPIFIEIWDEEMNLIDCNHRILELFGVSSKTEFMERYDDFSPKIQPCGTPSKEKARMMLECALKEGRCQSEWMHIDAKGNELPIESTCVRLEIQGKTRIVEYSHDLRQIKKAMMEMRRIEVAEASNEAKSRFLARMSHELRTPISAVLGISEIELQSSGLPRHLEESFAKIHGSANTLLGIVNDILDLSKIEAGKMEIIESEYDTASLINDIAHLHHDFIGDKPIQFIINIDENIPVILVGDILRIVQIMNNILSNAFKYTESGSVAMSICWENDALAVSIRDTGLGMTEEQVNNLHKEYTRFHERKMQGVIGTGLGMPIVYNMVKLMNGSIDLESQEGVGTTVTVRIPQKKAGHEVLGKDLALRLQQFKETVQTADVKFKFTPEPMPYGSVLVVDDVETNLYVARGLLGFYGLNIDTCTTGYEAIEKVKHGKVYDVIFMDQMMPGINGNEAMRAIRDLGYANPIVALTANAMAGQAEELIKSGFDGFISKPIKTPLLNSILNKFVRDRQPPYVIEMAKTQRLLPQDHHHHSSIEDFQNNDDFVANLRLDFAKNHKTIFTDITRALAKDDTKTAHRLAHTLKGLARLIREDALALLAKEVEEVLADNGIPQAEQLSILEKELNLVLESIDVPEADTLLTANKFDKDKAKVLFDKLTPFLEARDFEAQRLVGELCKIPETVIIVKQIEDFDYEAALQNLNILRSVLEV